MAQEQEQGQEEEQRQEQRQEAGQEQGSGTELRPAAAPKTRQAAQLGDQPTKEEVLFTRTKEDAEHSRPRHTLLPTRARGG